MTARPMELLLHTIALEPARWTPRRASRDLAELVPGIAGIGVRRLEVYSPHVEMADDWSRLREAFRTHGVEPVILSSYLNLDPEKTSDAVFVEELARTVEALDFFGFHKLRMFPGFGINPDDAEGRRGILSRLRILSC